jgi:hypothetical protein
VRIGLSARGFAALDPKIDLGFLGDITFQSQGHETNLNVPDGEVTNSGIGLWLCWWVLAPHTRSTRTPPSQVTLCSGSATAAAMTVEQVDQQGQYSGTSFVFPGFRMAFETALTSWLYFRSGLQYTYNFLSNAVEDVGPTGQTGDRKAQPALPTSAGTQGLESRSLTSSLTAHSSTHS